MILLITNKLNYAEVHLKIINQLNKLLFSSQKFNSRKVSHFCVFIKKLLTL